MNYMKFYLLVAMALIRGLRHRWPTMLFPRDGGVSAGGLSLRECRDMYRKHGWTPFCFSRSEGWRLAKVFAWPHLNYGDQRAERLAHLLDNHPLKKEIKTWILN